MPGQMPKVVDQDIAQMAAPPQQPMMPPQARPQMPPQAQAPQQQLPENTGIGQLPAQNMQGMADGGIVGYAEGGVPRFNGQTGSTPREQLRSQLYSLPSGRPGMFYAENVPTPTSTLRPEEAPPQFLAPGIPNPAYAAYLKREAARDRGVDPQAYDPNLFPVTTSAAPTTPAAAPTTPAAAPTTPVTTPTATKPTAPVVTPPKPAAAPAAPTGGIDTLKQEKDAIDRFKNNMVGSTETAVNRTDFLKELGDISQPAYDKANAMVEKEKGRLKEGKEQDFYMSLIEGGLAAASETGPHALQNIAKGFSKGAASYREGLKEFRKASQENAKMEVDLARAEAADKKGDIKSYYERMDQYETRKAKRDDTINSGIAQIINTSEHGKYTLAGAQLHKEGQIAAAGVSAKANQNLMEALGAAPEDSALRKGFDLQKTMAQQATLYEQYQKLLIDPTTGMMRPDVKALYPDFKTFLADYEKAIASKGTTGGGIKTIADPSKVSQPVLPR
jgi:hypothetical protein